MALIRAVTEAAFASHRQRDWTELDALARRATANGIGALTAAQLARVPGLYRDVCADLARATDARYSAPLVEYLSGVTASAHTLFYAPIAGSRRAGDRTRRVGARLWEAFPRAVRRHKRAVTLSFLLFFVPFFAGLFATMADPQFAFRIVPEGMLRPLTEAYAKGFAEGRGAGDSTLMAGFYVNNNVGIALRCFALGVFGGLGSAFYLVENGLSIGAILGFVASQGAGGNIVTFIVGHGTLELGAIVISGGAGLALGWSLVAPGDCSRIASLQAVAKDIVALVFGASVMLLMAAAIEGFWSGSSVPDPVKHGVGALLFALVIAYLALVGRGARDVAEAPP